MCFLSSSLLVTVSVLWLFLNISSVGLQCVAVVFLIILAFVFPIWNNDCLWYTYDDSNDGFCSPPGLCNQRVISIIPQLSNFQIPNSSFIF